jgi:hypothetical protein
MLINLSKGECPYRVGLSITYKTKRGDRGDLL